MNDDKLNLQSLDALADSWAEEIADDGFTAAVMARVQRAQRRRQVIVAVAGTVGGAIASLQFGHLAQHELVTGAAAHVAEPLQAMVQPANLTALFMAAIAVSVALILPNRV